MVLAIHGDMLIHRLVAVLVAAQEWLLNIAVQQATTSISGSLEPRHLQYTFNLYYAPLIGIESGTASSLPYIVLRSMLKQRRILMLMH